MDWRPEMILAGMPDAKLPEVLAESPRVVVTGCAGFIGGHLCEALLALGCEVTGIDCVTDYYDVALKRANLAEFIDHPRMTFVERDINDVDAVELLAGARAVFHLAAQAGVRASWGGQFNDYLDRNIQATQRLLEACKDPGVSEHLVRFVYSSSSSIYGDRADLPVTEAALPQPFSPYGVTKLAAEHLCVLYGANFGVPTSSLRYFTVYGPRQRPDMAFRKFLEAALDGKPWLVYGDGSQTRDFTFVSDAVRANLLAVGAPNPWAVYNVGGGARITLTEALEMMKTFLADEAPELSPSIEYLDRVEGDVRDTWADPAHIHAELGYKAAVPFAEGLRREVAWVVARRRAIG